jgi:hypothetical protein
MQSFRARAVCAGVLRIGRIDAGREEHSMKPSSRPQQMSISGASKIL